VPDLVLAIILFVSAIMASIAALIADAMYKNHDVDSNIQWRKSIGPFFSFGYGKQSLRIQSWFLTALSFALFAASAFFALRAFLAD
jgi:hypothetical protein